MTRLNAWRMLRPEENYLRCNARKGKKGKTRCERPALHLEAWCDGEDVTPTQRHVARSLTSTHAGRAPSGRWFFWPGESSTEREDLARLGARLVIGDGG